ncbi:hypothetical protein PNOK_0249500 [Pyrrhoderma noxium]|uniref:T6SS Phospholipase effector Tle1-like catalytic domain-containing protein n=1 Tax=Pyrrhoderma noxium TaxID=2282107 RepID=A0A286USI1_9AGAM|nr:hypothetical protein PNOK_0249500 [Pyrrhoderma noxium]
MGLDFERHENSRETTNSRSIVLCFDGTNNEYGKKNTNVLRLYSFLVKTSPKQRVYYQSGLGTFATHGLKTISKVLDLAFAHGLPTHVMDGYRFLMQYYRDGDKVSIFGFSRGAYTARVLASMVNRVGLLPPEHHAHMKNAWSHFKEGDEGECRKFRQSFSREVEIVFMGLWDTVASVGIYGLELPFAQDNGGVKVVRHALSLDERREKFQASFFEQGDKSDVKEVWFAGCHADVGGGAVDETEQNLLSNNSFRWMINELFKYDSDVQILFHTGKLQREAGYIQKKYEEAPTRGYLWLESIPEDFLKQYGLKKLKLSKREQEG